MTKRIVLLVFILLSLVCRCYSEELKDIWGRSVESKIPFKRIISLYGAHTENLFYLGLDKEIIGVGIHDDYPEKVKTKPRFSYHDGPEKFVAENPDLILVRPMIVRGYKDLFLKLKDFGIEVVSLQPTNFKEMLDYWLKLGRLTGKEKAAKKMVSDFLTELHKIKSLVSSIPYSKRKKVFLESIHRKFKTFAPNSISMFVLESAGGINIAKDAIRVRHTNIAYYGKERILAKGDKIDFYIAQVGPMNPITKETILNEPGFKAIKAVREGKVFLIKEEILSRPTPRIILGIKKIAKILYPEVFR